MLRRSLFTRPFSASRRLGLPPCGRAGCAALIRGVLPMKCKVDISATIHTGSVIDFGAATLGPKNEKTVYLMQNGMISIYDDDSRQHLHGPETRRKGARSFSQNGIHVRHGLAVYSGMAAGEESPCEEDLCAGEQ